MARLGSNPSRQKKTDFKPSRVTVAVLAYVPSQDGYFQHRFDILKLTINSILKNTQIEFDLMVFDNGCCEEVSQYLTDLKEAGQIDYLLSSPRNIGKRMALQMMFNSAMGEIIAYCDDDVLHYQGWLKPQIEILETFPRVGLVSGVPVRNARFHANSQIKAMVQDPPKDILITTERRIQNEWERDWAESTSRDPNSWLEETKDWQDVVLKKEGVEAVAHANHYQFIGYKKVLIQGIPQGWEGELMGGMVKFDENIDQLAYLRLSTTNRFVRHLGNSVSENLAIEARKLGLMDLSPSEVLRIKRHWILKIPGSGRILMWIYNWIYKIVFLREDL